MGRSESKSELIPVSNRGIRCLKMDVSTEYLLQRCFTPSEFNFEKLINSVMLLEYTNATNSNPEKIQQSIFTLNISDDS